MKTKNKLPMSQDPAHNWQASDGGKRALGKQAGFNSPHFPHLSFDGCGINGRDEYRTRLCTFTEKRGEDANHYGPIFAAAPEMFEACREALAYVNSQPDAPKGSIAEVAQCGVRHILKSALSLAQSKP